VRELIEPQVTWDSRGHRHLPEIDRRQNPSPVYINTSNNHIRRKDKFESMFYEIFAGLCMAARAEHRKKMSAAEREHFMIYKNNLREIIPFVKKMQGENRRIHFEALLRTPKGQRSQSP
jgi:hypothetical protein